MNCGDFAFNVVTRSLLQLHNNSAVPSGGFMGVLGDKKCVYTFSARRATAGNFLDEVLPSGATYTAKLKPLKTQSQAQALATASSVTVDTARKIITVEISLNTTQLDDLWGETDDTNVNKTLAFEIQQTETGGAETAILKASFTLAAQAITNAEDLETPADEYFTKTESDARYLPQEAAQSPVKYEAGAWYVKHPVTEEWHAWTPQLVGGVLTMVVDQVATP